LRKPGDIVLLVSYVNRICAFVGTNFWTSSNAIFDKEVEVFVVVDLPTVHINFFPDRRHLYLTPETSIEVPNFEQPEPFLTAECDGALTTDSKMTKAERILSRFFIGEH
jgi:hypothetical protein